MHSIFITCIYRLVLSIENALGFTCSLLVQAVDGMDDVMSTLLRVNAVIGFNLEFQRNIHSDTANRLTLA